MKKNQILDNDICDIVFANLIVLGATFLSTLLPYVNLILPILFWVYFKVGLCGFVCNKEQGRPCAFEDLFISIKKIIRILCVSLIKLFLFIFGLWLFLFPAILVFLEFCFSPFILFESENLDAKGVLMLSRELVDGYRLEILTKLLIAAASVCLSSLIMFGIVVLFDLFMPIPGYFYVIFITMAALLDLVLFAAPFSEVSIAESYIKAKNSKISR